LLRTDSNGQCSRPDHRSRSHASDPPRQVGPRSTAAGRPSPIHLCWPAFPDPPQQAGLPRSTSAGRPHLIQPQQANHLRPNSAGQQVGLPRYTAADLPTPLHLSWPASPDPPQQAGPLRSNLSGSAHPPEQVRPLRPKSVGRPPSVHRSRPALSNPPQLNWPASLNPPKQAGPPRSISAGRPPTVHRSRPASPGSPQPAGLPQSTAVDRPLRR